MKVVFASVAVVTAALAFSVGTATGGRVPFSALRSTEGPVPVKKTPARPKVRAAKPGEHAPYGPIGSRGIAVSGAQRRRSELLHGLPQRPGDVGQSVAREVRRRHGGQDDCRVAEKMIRKLRARDDAAARRAASGGDTLTALVETIEQVIDQRRRSRIRALAPSSASTAPSTSTSIRDLLGLDVNAGDYLPLDTKSANFDNIADVQALSPTLLEAYLNAAAAVSRMAVGDRTRRSTLATLQRVAVHVAASVGSRRRRAVRHARRHRRDARLPGRRRSTQFRLNIAGGIGTQLEDHRHLDRRRARRAAPLRARRRSEPGVGRLAGRRGLHQQRARSPIKAGQHKRVRRVRAPRRRSVRRSDQAARLVEGVERQRRAPARPSRRT